MVVLTVSLVASKFILEALVDLEWPLIVVRAAHRADRLRPDRRLVLLHQPTLGDPQPRRPTSDSPRDGPTSDGGPVIWLAALGAQMAMAAIVVGLDVPISSNTDGVTELQADRTYIVSLVITAVIAAPVVEEMVFRGVVLRGLRSCMPVVLAIVLQGVLFGAAHFDPVRGRGNLGLVMVLSGVGIVFGGGRRAAPPNRPDDRRPRHLQRGRADHRADRCGRPAPGCHPAQVEAAPVWPFSERSCRCRLVRLRTDRGCRSGARRRRTRRQRCAAWPGRRWSSAMSTTASSDEASNTAT